MLRWKYRELLTKHDEIKTYKGEHSPQPLGACTIILVRSKELLCLLSVLYIYTNRKEIKLCKKLIYSYSTRLAFHMPGFYLLTILNYLIVVPAPAELPCTYSGKLKLKHQSVTFFGGENYQ